VSIATESATRIVVVGGLDPGVGAGIARDLLTASMLGARAVLIGTAWTEQGVHSDRTIEARPAARVSAALAAALAKLGGTGAVKVGMVATAAIAHALDQALADYAGAVVYDPVLRASSGDALYDGDRQSVLALARRSTLLTPNLAEAAWLLDRPVETEADARAAGRALRELGIRAVLVKGGHLQGEATDILLSPAGETLFSSPRIAGPSPRGTGCALATAIAVGLARGETLEPCVAAAKAWLFRRIERAQTVAGEHHLGSD
jgi:hydroxymethylpyrimidine kinase/phosphomethylpyrimidine kinase